MDPIQILDEHSPIFPPSTLALDEPNGLLAVGGNLAPNTLVDAYSKGIFPWFSDDQPILWWSPNPRMVVEPKQLHIGRSLTKLAKKKLFNITVDQAFEKVMLSCGQIDRPDQDGTWINEEMLESYSELHRMGIAHSIEAWQDDKLVGGLYGIALGAAFFGESMFSAVSGASKIAFASLVHQLDKWEFEIIDCQIHTTYLESFGALEIPRKDFEGKLKHALQTDNSFSWRNNWALGVNGYDGSK